MKKLLTIAGSDCSGGAGIQADLKTFAAFGHYGMSAITALTAQNTTGVYGVVPTPPDFVRQQIDLIYDDIAPDAVKIGMVASAVLIETIAAALAKHSVKNLVIDPVMVSTSGSRLLDEDAVSALRHLLLPMATVITPNIPEAEALTGLRINDKKSMAAAAEAIAASIPTAILIKGGHLTDTADDLLFHKGQYDWFESKRIDTSNTHGTGCTLSSAIACGLAEKKSLYQSIADAKFYLNGALRAGLNLGKGSGPLDHFFTHPSRH
ncbi:bifunctional hydroxymethylpyrimidine kinase/phosphomethylpyrimidine kinase [Fusibacter paucivorans]|uniref:Hydroxymethylpyrimidine/phosphomethylpyrimidine kinase n=1 Tax=Fusibacter paucivorans TaxID=76009 RepID=A0ABS5PTZ9_9FIRM|nr:bifunctional hydroxymethylpyrimidine kinase/phosphomethylpyrimidine kinase [Fusibacter paucivorans]MBS7528640.1 bifunctional hydroxymethylpyrimidine kinase/phosphomethylpyrimidine kinase [Fusibacter paucivorans]